MEMNKHAKSSAKVAPVKIFAEVEDDRKPVTEMAVPMTDQTHPQRVKSQENAPKMSSNRDAPKIYTGIERTTI